MHAYPLYRQRRAAAALMAAGVAITTAIVAQLSLAPASGVTTALAPTAVAGAAQQVDPAALSIAAQQHVTLTQAEMQLSWQENVPSLNAALSSRISAAVYGGTWIATNDGERVKVGVVGLNPQLRATAMQAVRAAGMNAGTDLVPVRYSLGQLIGASTWLAGQLDELSPDTGGIHLDAGYRPDLNRVQLGVAGTMTTAERALVTRAKARYGSLIQVVAQPAGIAVGTSLDCVATPGQYCYPPLRGGINIFRVNSHSQPQPGECTAGFVARSRVDGKLYLFTAGHCAAEAGTGTWASAFPHGFVLAIGPVHRYIYGAGGDAAILAINSPAEWLLPQGWVYVLAGPNTTRNERYPIYSAQYSTMGARVCETGASSGSVCGTVLALGQTKCIGPSVFNCRWVNNLGEDSIYSQEGDSGAPVFAGHQAFGLVSGGGFDVLHGGWVTYYQGINGASNALNVNIVLAH